MTTPGQQPQQRRRRRITGIVAIVFLIVIAVVAVFVAVTGTESSSQRPDPPSRPSAPAPPSDSPPQGDQALPTTAPPARWEVVRGIALPISNEAGPRTRDGAVASDYQRSPVGALLASMHISTRYLVSPGEGWRQVTERQVLPGPGRDAYMKARATAGDDLGDTRSQFAGFRFITYTPDEAVIQLASKTADGGLIGTTVTVRWANGDWKVELQPTGAVSPSATPLADLSYYIPFSAGVS